MFKRKNIDRSCDWSGLFSGRRSLVERVDALEARVSELRGRIKSIKPAVDGQKPADDGGKVDAEILKYVWLERESCSKTVRQGIISVAAVVFGWSALFYERDLGRNIFLLPDIGGNVEALVLEKDAKKWRQNVDAIERCSDALRSVVTESRFGETARAASSPAGQASGSEGTRPAGDSAASAFSGTQRNRLREGCAPLLVRADMVKERQP